MNEFIRKFIRLIGIFTVARGINLVHLNIKGELEQKLQRLPRFYGHLDIIRRLVSA